MLPLLILNYTIWGEPLRGAYARIVTFENGEAVLDSTSHTFGLSFFPNEWSYRLFDKREAYLGRADLGSRTAASRRCAKLS